MRNFAIITHAVPVERVRPHVPERFRIQTFDIGGETRCLVSATCFCNTGFRYSGLPYPRMTFNESTYRVYVDYDGRNGVFFVGRYLGHPVARAAQRIFDRDVYLGDFEVETSPSDIGYDSYTCRVKSRRGETSFALSATNEARAQAPFATADEHTYFVTHRLHGLFTSSTGAPGHMPVTHDRMKPWQGELRSGRFELWERLGILYPDEVADVFSVLVQSVIDFKLHPVRPVF